MTNPLQQLLAVSVLIGQCEAIAESGLLGEVCERDLRWTVAKTLAAFNMPTRAERANDNLTSPDAALDLIRPVMAEEVL